MKDRLVIYDEETKKISYENGISPSEIFKIDDSNLFFITKFKNDAIEVRNYALYSLNNFSIKWELKLGYKQLSLNKELGILWVDDYKNKGNK
jgi:hypothetical protein